MGKEIKKPTDYEIALARGKAWNENRAKSEEKGIELFRKRYSDPILHPKNKEWNTTK